MNCLREVGCGNTGYGSYVGGLRLSAREVHAHTHNPLWDAGRMRLVHTRMAARLIMRYLDMIMLQLSSDHLISALIKLSVAAEIKKLKQLASNYNTCM